MNLADHILKNKWLQWVLMFIAVAFLGLSSYEILTLPLWGNWPLIWLLSIWLLIVAIFWQRISNNRDSIFRFGLSTCTGLLLALAFPVSPLTPLIFCAFVPLLILYDRNKSLSYFRFFSHLYNAFFLWNIITTFWVLNTSFMPGIVANVINTGLMTIPWLLFKKAESRFSFRTSLWALVAFWISFEFAHLHWEISWPWLNIGHTFAAQPTWVQWYSLTGIFGGALWIWIINLMIFRIIAKQNLSPKAWQNVVIAVLLPLLASLVMYYTHSDKGEEAEVVIVQPNYEPHYEKFDVPQVEQVRRMKEMALGTVDDDTEFLLFPETVISRVRLNNYNSHRGIRAFREVSEAYEKLNLISGISSFRTYAEDSLISNATRLHVDARGDSTYWDVQNNAIWMKNGEIADMYFKSKLVPGAEIFPYRHWLPFLKPIVDQLGGSVEGLTTQETRESFGPDGLQAAPVICYESVYGKYVGDYVKAGADAIFIMTNDGWWDVTPGHIQHLHFARLRAIEQRKSVARAANTGISCFINQRGDIIQPTLYGQDAVIKGKIKFNSLKTFYTTWGDFIAWAAVLFSICFVIASFLPSYYVMKKGK